MAERVQWLLSGTTITNTTDGSIPRLFAYSQITNELAEARAKNVIAHINTDHTARDMLTITEAHGWEKIKYWGFSHVSEFIPTGTCMA